MFAYLFKIKFVPQKDKLYFEKYHALGVADIKLEDSAGAGYGLWAMALLFRWLADWWDASFASSRKQ